MIQKPMEQASALEIGPVRGIASVEQRAFGLPGVPALLLWFLLLVVAGGFWVGQLLLGGLLLAVTFLVLVAGFFVVQPNRASVVTLLGRYVGTERRNGFYWTNPFTTRKKLRDYSAPKRTQLDNECHLSLRYFPRIRCCRHISANDFCSRKNRRGFFAVFIVLSSYEAAT